MHFGRHLSVRFAIACTALLALVSGSGCDSTSTPLTPTTVPYSISSVYFLGTLSVGGTTSSYNLNVTAPTTISAALVNLQDGSNNLLPTSVTLTLGVVATSDVTQCTPLKLATTSTSLTNAITMPVPAGTYCATLTDPGTLPIDANFALKVTKVVGSTAPTSATTDAFTTFLQPGASVSKTFTVGTAGPVTLNLASSGTPPVSLDLAIGGWDGSVCHLTRHVTAIASSAPQITIAADAGTYCAQVSDIGFVTAKNFSFLVNIGHS